jgi:hypothetical protein
LQRKGSVLKKSFALITAILFIVLISTLLALTFYFSTKSAKKSGDIFAQKQAELLAISSTGFAILAISGHNFSSNCVEKINIQYPDTTPVFDINITLMYIGKNLPCSPNTELNDSIATADSNGTVIIDTLVTYKLTPEPVRFHKRTIQKP